MIVAMRPSIDPGRPVRWGSESLPTRTLLAAIKVNSPLTSSLHNERENRCPPGVPGMQSRKLSDDLADIARANQQTRDAALLRATTELFVQDLTHDEDEIRRYEELAIHFLPKVPVEVRATVAERLAICADAPRAVVRALARDVFQVAAPVIRRSPVLDSFDLLSVIAATDIEHQRLIARRSDLSDDVKRALRLTGDNDVTGYLDNGPAMRAAPAEEADSEPKTVHRPDAPTPQRRRGRFDIWQFIDLDRPTRLRVIADIAMGPPIPRPAATGRSADRAFQSILSAAQIVGFARDGRIAELIAAIADGLELGPDAVAASVRDRSGEPLAVLLKALRLDELQAQQVFLMASPVGRDVQVFFPLTDLYAGMDHSTAETLCEAWRIVAAERNAGHEPYLAENADRRRGTMGTPVRVEQSDRDDQAKRA